MSPPRLRVPLAPIDPGERALPPDAANYVVRVHRLREGDHFIAFDPERAVEADVAVIAIGRRDATVRIGSPRPASLRPRRRVTLLQCIGKGDKMDSVVRDATELSATRIVPVLAERSVARPAADRRDRWRRIAIEAARQCGRGDAPRIDAPLDLAAAIAGVGAGAAGISLDPRAEAPLGARLRALAPEAEIALVIGPEGGLTADELGACAAAGFTPARLGRLTLRTETVCAAALGALLALEDGGDG
ncbi:MAG: 16S rRNA (uracil(1498)-N(3))-methyltransferase [Polyangiaceae bacterium]|nr:16S rRNA (uracil(1498)-N(3))-methyltransferase [Polyangiaceae bacterium]